MRIAVDAMGGDHAPSEIVAGAVQWVQHNEGSLILLGQPLSWKKSYHLMITTTQGSN